MAGRQPDPQGAPEQRPPSLESHFDCVRLYNEYKQAKQNRDLGRQDDMNRLRSEAAEAGFTKHDITSVYDSEGSYFVLGIGNLIGDIPRLREVTLHLDTYDNIYWSVHRYAGIEDTRPFQPEDIETFEISPEAVYFLEWALEWQKEIISYWHGETPFNTIDEFIQYLKENHKAVFSSPMVKSAAKSE